MTGWPRRRPVLCLVSDRSRLPASSVPALIDHLRAAVRAGIDLVQIRERDLADAALVDLVRQAIALARPEGVSVVVNDRLDVAMAAGADGVHLRGDSMPPDRVRREAPPSFLIGRSIHSAAEADAVVQAGGCDYLLFGTVFPSAGKPQGHPVAGVAMLRDVCRRTALPVLAIGGIDASNAAEVAAAGAAGMAAIGSFVPLDAAALATRVRDLHEGFDRGSSLV
jgi:thiamine-phosphate pyrophosphorylase